MAGHGPWSAAGSAGRLVAFQIHLLSTSWGRLSGLSEVRHLRTLLAVSLLLASQVTSLAAQWPREITPGTRVQVRLPEAQYQFDGKRGHFLRGRVTALSADTLYLAVTDSVGPLAVPRGLINDLAFSRGVPSRAESAVKRGLLLGALNALLTVGLTELDDNPGWDTGKAALIGGAVGLGTGLIVGAIFPRERWKSLELRRDSDRVQAARMFRISTAF